MGTFYSFCGLTQFRHSLLHIKVTVVNNKSLCCWKENGNHTAEECLLGCGSPSTAVTYNSQCLEVVPLYCFQTGATQLLVAEFTTQLQLPWLPVTHLLHEQASETMVDAV